MLTRARIAVLVSGGGTNLQALLDAQAAGLLRDIIDQLENERGVVSLEKRRAAILALACKRSVRSGERLNDTDIRELVSRVADKRVIPASPRGTPLVVALNKTDIDRRFRRMQ